MEERRPLIDPNYSRYFEEEEKKANKKKESEFDTWGMMYYLGVRGLLAGFLAGSAHLAIVTFLKHKYPINN